MYGRPTLVGVPPVGKIRRQIGPATSSVDESWSQDQMSQQEIPRGNRSYADWYSDYMSGRTISTQDTLPQEQITETTEQGYVGPDEYLIPDNVTISGNRYRRSQTGLFHGYPMYPYPPYKRKVIVTPPVIRID